ncbi:MAG: RidA family protein [Phycisphaerales bacterium]
MPDHDPNARLADLGLTLPEAPKPVASYIPARRTGSLVVVSGQIPMVGGELMARGRVPGEVDLETAVRCARQCLLNGLAVLAAEAGSLDRLERVVRLGCFVACDGSFTEHPKVANGASDLLLEIFGDRGRHARAAVGCPSLPLGAPVEIEFLFELRA